MYIHTFPIFALKFDPVKNRTVKFLLPAHEYQMGQLTVKQPFPTQKVEYPDPFLLLHHALVRVNPDVSTRLQGVGPHPHRGFSPVTFIFEGGVHHQDSRGNNSVVYKGGVQWMNAGMGIIHSERPPTDIFEHGGIQEIIQMWVNTPSVAKMKQPEYYAFSDNEITQWKNPAGKTFMKIISGSVMNLEGPVTTPLPINSATIQMYSGEQISLPVVQNHEAFIYLLDGELIVPGYGLVPARHALFFNQDGEGITIQAKEDTRILFMSGKPINEPMASQGPFVMSNETQLLEAMRDYRMGKMGILIED